MQELETERLLLRQWKDSDYPAFARMSADAETMRYFPSVLTDAQSRDIADRCRELIDQRGWGFWAVEVKASNDFAGFIGLHVPSAELPFSPCVEIGWRLARDFWGQGLATEGAQAALDFAFHELSLAEVVAFTTLSNTRSQRVMQRLGMVRSEKTFEHPGLPEGHELRQHVLYRKNQMPELACICRGALATVAHGPTPVGQSGCQTGRKPTSGPLLSDLTDLHHTFPK